MKQYLLSLALSIATIFAPVKQVMVVTFILIAVDLLLGLMAARKIKVPITSAGLRRTVSKLFVYEVAICLGFLVETYFTGPAIPIVKIITGFIGLTELKSCLENADAVNGEPILKALIDKLGSSNQ